MGKYTSKTLGYIKVSWNRVFRVYTRYGEIHEQNLRVYPWPKENIQEKLLGLTSLGLRHHSRNTKAFAIGLGLVPRPGRENTQEKPLGLTRLGLRHQWGNTEAFATGKTPRKNF